MWDVLYQQLGEENKFSSSPFAIARVFKVAPQFLARVELLKERLAGRTGRVLAFFSKSE